MKKIYLALLIIIPVFNYAQTITQSDLPVAGQAFTFGNDSNYVSAIPAGGTGQTWNYASLQNLVLDTTGFIAAAGTPYASSFPGSNMASQNASTGGYSYFTTNSNGMYFDGLSGTGTTVVFNPSQLYIPVPFSYNDTRNNTSRAQIDTLVFIPTLGITANVRYVIRNESIFLADGSGALTTPTGTYPNVLRIKITQLTYDSIYVDLSGLGVYSPYSGSASQVTHYRFVTSGLQVNYIMGIEADSLGNTSTSSHYLVDPTLSVPIVNDNKTIVAYPNPAINAINFRFLNENTNVVVYDNNGKEVLRSNATDSKRLNVEMLKNGVYHYEIIQHDKIQKGSIVIQH